MLFLHFCGLHLLCGSLPQFSQPRNRRLNPRKLQGRGSSPLECCDPSSCCGDPLPWNHVVAALLRSFCFYYESKRKYLIMWSQGVLTPRLRTAALGPIKSFSVLNCVIKIKSVINWEGVGGHSIPSGCCHFYFHFLSSSPGVYNFIAPWSAFAEWHVGPWDTTLKKNPLIQNYRLHLPRKISQCYLKPQGFLSVKKLG